MSILYQSDVTNPLGDWVLHPQTHNDTRVIGSMNRVKKAEQSRTRFEVQSGLISLCEPDVTGAEPKTHLEAHRAEEYPVVLGALLRFWPFVSVRY